MITYRLTRKALVKNCNTRKTLVEKILVSRGHKSLAKIQTKLTTLNMSLFEVPETKEEEIVSEEADQALRTMERLSRWYSTSPL